jgi:hypothetical protein
MEGWRQEWLDSRAGTHRDEERNKTSLQKERKTYLTHTGLLMEGVTLPLPCRPEVEDCFKNARTVNCSLWQFEGWHPALPQGCANI